MKLLMCCPEVGKWHQLVRGQMPADEAEFLLEHLTNCAACLKTMRAIRVEDTLEDDLRSQATAAEQHVPQVIQHLMQRLKGIWLLAQASEPTQDGAADQSSEVYDVLRPAQSPGELGRLGSYRVLKLLGSGGMGAVFLAQDIHLDRLVALKVVKPSIAMNPSTRQRLLHEAKACAALRNDHIISIYQVGEDAGAPFIAMEHLEGRPLDELLQGGNKLTAAQIVRIGREIAQGLGAAHAKGLIHRDIKPSNIWLEKDSGRVKILDFGLARPQSADVHLTQSGTIVGTPAYMAPEQARSEKLDGRCDLFSLGCVLYRLCTGISPFAGDTTMAVLMALALETPRPVKDISPAMPAALSDLIAGLLAKEPQDRPASAQAVVKALQEIENSLGGSQADAPKVQAAKRKTRVAPAWLAAAAVLLLAVGGVLLQPLVIRITHKDGSVSVIKTNGKVEVIEPGKEPATIKARPIAAAPSNPFDGFSRDQITNEDLAAAGGGHAKDAPAELVGVLKGEHTSPLWRLALHPDGQHLICGDAGGTICVWDLCTRQCIVRFSGDNRVRSLSFSADGSRIATTLWKYLPTVFESGAAGKLLERPIRSFNFNASTVALSPDGQRLATASFGGDAKVWDVATGQECLNLSGHTDGIHHIVFNNDGTRLATASADGTAQVWDASSGRSLLSMRGRGPALTCVTFSPDGELVAAAGLGDRVPIHAATTGQKVVDCLGEFSLVHALAFSPDARLLAAATHENQLFLWQVPSGKVVRSWSIAGRSHGSVTCVLFSPDGRHLLYSHTDGHVYVLRWKQPAP